MLVRRAAPVPFECVVRGYLSGSAWAEYRARGTLAGEPLPAGLAESSRLDPPLFSPATKAETGHDTNVTFETVAGTLGRTLAERLRAASFAIYQAGRAHAADRGIIIADTKFEFGVDGDGRVTLADEAVTPDSSRFWPAADYAPGRPQRSFDKQFVRDFCLSTGWDRTDPGQELPEDVVSGTRARYVEAFERLTGMEFVQYDTDPKVVL
jgi:phosphoribosylaminoimidazole-succinocarboxamide synthase